MSTEETPYLEKLLALQKQIATVIHGQSQSIEWLICAIISGGHILLEDNPGTGKTTLSKTLAKSIQAKYQRIQFTPDMMPSDITGVSIFEAQNQSFQYHEGPIFTQILLADEINRASPRTQSALLEAMAENQVTAEGKCYTLDPFFFVIATQNPFSFQGTYPLPEAQLDRFAMKFSLGYITTDQEIELLNHDTGPQKTISDLKAVISPDDILEIRKITHKIQAHPNIKRYIVDLVSASRKHPKVQLGASPRASISIYHTAQVMAYLNKRDYIIPDDVQNLLKPMLTHRILPDPSLSLSGQSSESIVQDIIEQTPLPDQR